MVARRRRSVDSGSSLGILFKLSLIAAAAIIVTPMVLAAPAHADAADFIDYLERNGIPSPTRAIAADAVDLGNAICGLYSANVDAGRNPKRAVMAQLAEDGNSNPAVWTVGSVTYLCPQYEYLLP
jgi:Protein of unknown function (DUF732)